MRLSDFVGLELGSLPLLEISVRSWPFELVAPLAAWFWINTSFRPAADNALAKLKLLEFDATISCAQLEDVPLKADERLLSNAYHRALLELVAPLQPHWRLECNDLGQLRWSGPEGRRAQGQQFGMLEVFPDSRALADHLKIDVRQLADLSDCAGMCDATPNPPLVRRQWRAPTQRR